MSSLNYELIAIFIINCFVVASILLSAYQFRNKFGLTLLYVILGLFKALHFFLARSFTFEIINGVHVSLGSVVLSPAILFTILLLFIRDDAVEARKVITALIGVNFVFVILQLTTGLGLDYISSGVHNNQLISQTSTNIHWRVFATGTLIIFIDSFIIIYLFEILSNHIKNLFLRIFLTMGLVFLLHAVLFAIGGFAGTSKFQTVLISGLFAKIIPLFVYSFIFWFHIKFVVKFIQPEPKFFEKFLDVFSFLTYQKKYKELKFTSEKNLNEKINELTSLNTIFKNISTNLATSKLVDTVLEEIHINIKPDLILFYKRESSNLNILGSKVKNLNYKIDKLHPHKVGICLCGLAVKTKTPQYSINITSDNRCTLAECKVAGINSFAAIPLLKEGEVIGVIGIASIQERDFNSQSYFIEAIASQASIALTNSILLTELQKEQNNLQNEIKKREATYFKLLEKEKRYYNIFHNSPISIWEEDFGKCFNYLDSLVDKSNKSIEEILKDDEVVRKCVSLVKIIDINNTTLKLYEVKAKEELLQNLSSVFIPESLPAFRSGLLAIYNGISAFETETTNKTLKGKKFDIDVKWNLDRSLDETNSIVIVSLLDITERKLAENNLHNEHNRLADIIENMSDAFVSLDENWCYTAMNTKAGLMFDRDPKEMIGKHIWTEFPESVGQPFQLNYEKAMKEKTFIRMEEYYPPYDKWFENRINPTNEGIAIFFTDITERKENEEALIKLSEERLELESIVNNSQAVAFLWKADDNWTVEYVSDNVSQFGYNKEQLLTGDIPFSNIIYQADIERVSEEVNHYSLSDEDKFVQEYRIITKEKEIRWIEDRTWIRRNKENVITHYQGILFDITDRKKTEAELNDKTMRILKAEKIAHLGFIDWDLVTNEVFLSDEIYNLYGMQKKDNHDVIEFIHKTVFPEDVEFVKNNLDMAINNRKRYNIDHRILRPDGKIVWVNAQAELTFDDNGKPHTLLGTVLDITERKLAIEKLKENETRFRTIVENSHDGIAIIDNNYKMIYANQELINIFGYPLEEIIGANIEKFLTPECKDLVLERYKRRQNGKNVPKIYEITIKRENESIKNIRMSATTIKNINGEIRTVAQLLDITNEKLAQKELAESENQLRTIIEQAGDAMFLVDFDGNIIEVNKKACESLGYTHEELLKLNIEKISLFFKRDNEKQQTWNKFKPNETSTIHRTHIRKDGTTFPVEISTGLLEIDNEKFVIGFARDITEREKNRKKLKQYRENLEEMVKNRTEQLVEANKELEAFSYSVSHDLRAPLRHINGFIELLTLNLGSKLNNKSNHYLETIAHASDQMGVLIDELLDFSRMGRKNMIAAEIDFNELVFSVKEEFTNATENKNRIINWAIDNLPIAKGDASMLKVVFTNLISNAIKYSSKKEETNIHVGCDENKDEYIFFVEDNGAGFDSRFADKLFGVFQRLHSKKEFEGTGIGLANVRRIVNRHGGRTWAESVTGEKAIFFFSLPKNFSI